VRLDDRRVEVDGHRLLPWPEAERPGSPERFSDHGVKLADVPEGEGAKERPECGWRQLADFTTLAAEYETLARAAQQQRWDELLDGSGLSSDCLEQLRHSDAYGPLLAALREAEAGGIDVKRAFPKLAAARPLSGADDPAAVMHARVDRWAQAAGSRGSRRTNLVAGLIPRAVGVTDADMVQAFDDRDEAMERRARVLAEEAVEHGKAWVRRLGPVPSDPAEHELWLRALSTVAAYRDRWKIGDDPSPLGSVSVLKTRQAVSHRRRAQVAAETGRMLGREIAADPPDPGAVAVGASNARAVEL
jgi:hypothetical protein